jgi:putative addiction module component (TIGR02574 family)
MLDSMVRKWSIEDFRGLSVEERLELIGDLWDSIADTPEALPPLTEAQKKELDARLAEADRNPNVGSSWEEVEARILKRKA